MTIETIIGVLMAVSLIELLLILRLFRNAKTDRKVIGILLKGRMKEMVENMEKGLENLFNNHNGKNSKKGNDKNKHQN